MLARETMMAKRWVDLLMRGGLTSFGGVGVGIALLLIIALRILLPKGERKKIRAPVWLLLLHVGTVALRVALPVHVDAQKPLGVAAVFFLLACLGRGGFLLVVDWFLGKRLARPLSRIFRDIIQVFVYAAVALLTLRAMGVEPGSLLTTSALLTAVIGLSLQETLGNLFAGLSIQAQRPFEVGDWVQLDADVECIGRVTEINWRATKVLTDDMVEVIVPNGTLAKAPIRNFSQPTRVSRRTTIVQAAYEAPPGRVQKVLLEAIGDTPGVLDMPPASVLLTSFADSGIEYRIRYFIDDFQRRNDIDSRVRARIWYAFQRANLSIPFPIRDVRTSDARAAASAEHAARLEKRLRALHNVDFFDALPERVLARLAENSEVRLYAPDENVIVQGAEGNELFILLDGAARVLVATDDAEPAEVARLEPGKVFGEMSLLTGEKRSATVKAGARCELLVVGHEALRPLLKDMPELAERISEVLAKRRKQLDEQAESSRTPTVEEKAPRDPALLSKIKQLFSL
jgi:small-conductance mechanosensitive channel